MCVEIRGVGWRGRKFVGVVRVGYVMWDVMAGVEVCGCTGMLEGGGGIGSRSDHVCQDAGV